MLSAQKEPGSGTAEFICRSESGFFFFYFIIYLGFFFSFLSSSIIQRCTVSDLPENLITQCSEQGYDNIQTRTDSYHRFQNNN